MSNANLNKFQRQSFLGRLSEEQIAVCRVGVIGLGGGGSHVVQQLAHIGFNNYVLLDPDIIEDSNLNRLIGGMIADAMAKRTKIEIAERLIRGLCPEADIEALSTKWQNSLNHLKGCDIIFGCVDGFSQRRDIETLCRRYLIPYIDIGMDIHCIEGHPPRMAGQVILSMPGHACMRCIGFLTEDNLAKEGQRYGDAGSNPQVVWCNGVLASIAVGLAVDLVTDWSKSLRTAIHLSYDGNTNTVIADRRLEYIELAHCEHYPVAEIGEPRFKKM